MTPQDLMKQEVGKAAAARVQSNSIVGLGTGSTTAFAIDFIGTIDRNVKACGISFATGSLQPTTASM